MNIKISNKVFSKYPKLQLGIILIKDIDNKTKLKDSLHLLKEAERFIHLTFNKENIKNHHLISPWSVAKEHFGSKATHYHTSVEKLLNKTIKKRKISTKDVLTNVVRYLSLKHIIPVGVDDLDKIEGNINFSMATGREKRSLLKNLNAGDLFYSDRESVLGSKLDSWKVRRTKLSDKTVSVLIHFDFLPPLTKKKVNEVMRDASSLVNNFCGGKIKYFILDKKKTSMKI